MKYLTLPLVTLLASFVIICGMIPETYEKQEWIFLAAAIFLSLRSSLYLYASLSYPLRFVPPWQAPLDKSKDMVVRVTGAAWAVVAVLAVLLYGIDFVFVLLNWICGWGMVEADVYHPLWNSVSTIVMVAGLCVEVDFK